MDKCDTRRTRFWIALVLAVLTVTAYSRVVNFDFTNFDDNEYVTDNKMVTGGLTWKGIFWAFTHCYSANWHPLTWISHMLDCQVFGLWAGGHHLVNVLFHTANSVILFLLLYRLTRAQWRSAIVAALFALHPLHVESVAWISERKDVLSTFFGLLSLMAYVNYVEEFKVQSPTFKVWRARALILFALGLLAKPMLVTLPCVMLLLDFWPLQRVENVGVRTFFTAGYRKLILEKWPWFAMVPVSCIATFYAQKSSGAVMNAHAFPFFWRLVNSIQAYFTYLGEIFWPAQLGGFYPLEHEKPVVLLLFDVILLILISGAVSMTARRRPYLLVGWLWFLGVLVPVIGLVQVGEQSHADRYTYVPSIGIFIAVVWLVGEFAIRSRTRVAMAGAGACAIIVLCAGATMMQANTWQNGLSLFRRAAYITPDSPMVLDHLGMTLLGNDDKAEALKVLQLALSLGPTAPDIHRDIGYVLGAEGKRDEAFAMYKEELKFDPKTASKQNLVARELTRRGKKEEALPYYAEAVRLKPDDAECQDSYGVGLAAVGRKTEAEPHYAEAVRLEPDNAHYQNNYATALARVGRTQEAIDHYLIAIEQDPGFAEPYSNLGALYFGQHRLDEAVDNFQKAIALNPKDADAYNNLGNVFISLGKTDAAITQYSQALRYNGTNAIIRVNLAKALSRMGRTDEAKNEFTEALRIVPDSAETRCEFGRQLFMWRQIPEAFEQLNEAVRLQPNYAPAQFHLGAVCIELKRETEGMEHFREALRLRPDWAEPMNAAAWTLATSHDEHLRDGAEAVRLAEKASQLTSRRQPAVLNTLAAAYAQAGRFPDAISTAKEALDLAHQSNQASLIPQISNALAAYQANQPFRPDPQ